MLHANYIALLKKWLISSFVIQFHRDFGWFEKILCMQDTHSLYRRKMNAKCIIRGLSWSQKHFSGCLYKSTPKWQIISKFIPKKIDVSTSFWNSKDVYSVLKRNRVHMTDESKFWWENEIISDALEN